MQATEKQARAIVNIASRRLWWRSDSEMYVALAALIGQKTILGRDEEVAALSEIIDKQTASKIISYSKSSRIKQAIEIIKGIKHGRP